MFGCVFSNVEKTRRTEAITRFCPRVWSFHANQAVDPPSTVDLQPRMAADYSPSECLYSIVETARCQGTESRFPPKNSASAASWVTSKTVLSSETARTASMAARRFASSSPLNGSSSTSRSDSAQRARASAHRRRIPPESSAAGTARLSPRPSRASISRASRSFFRPAVSRTFSSAVSCGRADPPEIPQARRAGTPAISPSSGVSRPRMKRSSVVFPPPETPVMTLASPSGSLAEKSRKTTVSA